MGNTAEAARTPQPGPRGRGGEWQVSMGMRGTGLTHLSEVAADGSQASSQGVQTPAFIDEQCPTPCKSSPNRHGDQAQSPATRPPPMPPRVGSTSLATVL